MIGWLRRAAGLGKKRLPPPPRPAPRPRPIRSAPPSPRQTSSQFRTARERVVQYMRRVRVPIRQAVTVRQLWIADLNQVYEAIHNSPTELILERAGDVGMRYEEAFRDALSQAQGIQPPRECEEVHHALVSWLTHLHAACLSLMDARRLRDRSLLGLFRERLGLARRNAQTLALLRNQLVAVYKLRIEPTGATNQADGPGGAPASLGPATPSHGAPRPAAPPAPPPPVRIDLSRRRPGG
jgi:hypothetical protein